MSESQGSAAKDRELIRRQLLWTLALMALLAAGAGLWRLGQDWGWGSPQRAVARGLARAEKALVAGRLEEAAALYRRVAERYPAQPQAGQAQVQLAAVLDQAGRPREALEVLEKLDAELTGKPDKADLLAYNMLQVGKLKLELRDFDGAREAYAAVRVSRPRSDWAAEAQQGLGHVLQAQGRYAEARAAYGVLVRELPKGFLAAEAQIAIGACFELEKDPRAALKAYQTVMERYPEAVWDEAKARYEALKKKLDASPAKTSTRG